jgi:hypothetical protein
MTKKVLSMEAAGMDRTEGREVTGYPVARLVAADTFDAIGIRAQWFALDASRSITGDPWRSR